MWATLGFQPVLLWSDLLIYFLLLGGGLWFGFALRREDWRVALRQVTMNRVAMVCFGILCCYSLIGFLDTLHFRRVSTDSPNGGSIQSVLDALCQPLIERGEKTYSAPFATHLFAKETVVLTDGRQVREYPRLQYAGSHLKRGVGYVPQGREIFGRLTVEENLRMGLATKSGSTQIPTELFDLFPVLKQMINRRGGDLSGGQQQQLAIARALAAGPKLLMLDEPTEGIQPSIIKDIGRVIRMLADRGTMAIVLVEQYYDFAAELADQYLVMERGEVVQRGRGKDMEAEGVRAKMSI